MDKQQGKVYLIGAGPGDPGLLTLKGRDYLSQADVVVYDRLADPHILAYARPEAELIYVGKASSKHTLKQPEINALLVKLAGAGKIVARLKGGDSFVFGRGGEEALELQKAGLPFEFVPGITSAIAVPEYAGIPVTHRHVATSFAVITGHEDPTKGPSSINWQGLATSVDTLVFLMGVENLQHITSTLIAHGRPSETPAALIRWGTHPEQQTLVTTLGQAYAAVQAAQLKPPAIFIVGEVVNLRKELAWFEKKPLFGKTVVVTRARAQASRLTQQLTAVGAKVLEVPAIKIVPPASYAPLDQALAKLDTYQWLLFTSANGVEAFFTRLELHHLDARALAGCKLAVIGSGTAAALKKYGLQPDVVPATYQAEDLAAALKPHLQPGARVLLPRAAVARSVLPETLQSWGAQVTVVPVYQTVQDDAAKAELLAALHNKTIDYITFTSSSTVTNFLKLIDQHTELLADVQLAAIGPITKHTCAQAGLHVGITAREYTIPGLVSALVESNKI
jgi:uroporphyrinogen III methyltransferase/synthase